MFCVVKGVVGLWLHGSSNAEQALERVERKEPPVESERELVQVCMKVLWRHAVVNAIQPSFEVAEDEVNKWQVLLRDVRIATLRDLREYSRRKIQV